MGYLENENLFYSMNFNTCLIQFFDLDVQHKSIVTKSSKIPNGCSELYGSFVQNKNQILYFYGYFKFSHFQLLNYPDLKTLSDFYIFNVWPCNGSIQNYYEQFQLILSVCYTQIYLYNLKGRAQLSLRASSNIYLAQNIDNYLYLGGNGIVYMYNFSILQIENSMNMKSNPVQIIKQESTSMLFIGLSSGDIIYTDMKLQQKTYFKIQNDLKRFFLHPILSKIYCIQLTNPIQQADMNVGLYAQDFKEGEFKFNQSGQSITGMHFSVRLKQIILIQDSIAYFIDIRTNQIKLQFNECLFENNFIQYSFFDEQTNILILSSQETMCSISLTTMKVLQNQLLNSISSDVVYISSEISYSKDGYIQFTCKDYNSNQYLVIINIEDFGPIFCSTLVHDGVFNDFSFDQQSQSQFLLTSIRDTQILTITDYMFNPIKKHILPLNLNYQKIFFLCKKYALITNTGGFGVFISLETFQILLYKQYFSTNFTTTYYNDETKLLLISSDSSSFQLSKLDIETGEEIFYYQKLICYANNQKVISELDIFVLACRNIPEKDNTFIKVVKLSTGELIDTIKSQSYIHDSIFISPYEILLYEVEYISNNNALQCEAFLANLSQFYNPTQSQKNRSKQIYYIGFIWQQEEDIYYVATRDGNIYQYYPTKSKFQLIEIFKKQIIAFDRIKSNINNHLAYIQLPTKILIYNLQNRHIIQELKFRANQFLQIKNYFMIIKRPFTINILSKEYQLIQEITLLNKINEVEIIQLDKQYALITSFDGFVYLINIETGTILWKKQTEQYRIQGYCIDQYFTVLITFSRVKKLNIFTVNNLKDYIILQSTIQLQQPIKKVFIMENKIIVTYLNFRYIDIYEFGFQNKIFSVQFKDFLILPFKLLNYVAQIINQNSQLIVYSDFQFVIYNFSLNQLVFKSSKSYFTNKIVQITSISSSILIISCEQDIEVVEVNTEDTYFRKDYSVWKSLTLFSSNSFKIINILKKFNDLNQIKSLTLIGVETQSIKMYQVYLIDYNNNLNPDSGCQISFKGISNYDLENKFKSLYELNKNMFKTYGIRLIIEQDNINRLITIPNFQYQNSTTIVFDGSSNQGQLNFIMNDNLKESLKFYRIEFINFNIILSEQIKFNDTNIKEVFIKNCSITKGFDQQYQDKDFLSFDFMTTVEILNFNISNFSQPFTQIISIRNVSFIYITNIYITNSKLQNSIVVFCDTAVVISAQNIFIENNTLEGTEVGSQIFQFNKLQYFYVNNLKIYSNQGKNDNINKQSTIIQLVNCENIDNYNTQCILNQNLILFSVSSKQILETNDAEDIIIFKLINVLINNIFVYQNINNDIPLIQFNTIMSIYIIQANFTSNECLSSIVNFMQVKNLQIEEVTFEKNIGLTIIEIIKNLSILISNGKFLQNTSLQNGGVFKISNEVLIQDQEYENSIRQCQFIQNIAFYSGGAIYLENSKINITKSYFKENTASIGGSIRYIGLQPNFIIQKPSNQYQKNKAFIFGQNIGSYPQYLVVDSRRKLDEFLLDEYRSGQTVENLLVYVLDDEKNIVNLKYEDQLRKIKTTILNQTKMDQKKIEEIYKNTTQLINEEIEQYIITATTPNNSHLSVSNQTIFQYDSLNNYFNLYGLVIYGIPEQSASILFQAPFIKEFNQDGIAKDNLNHTVNIKFRKCIRGELYSKRTDTLYECERCLDNRYSLVDPNITDISQVCKQCSSDNAEICELDQITLKKGYWRESVLSDEILFCENSPSNCEGTESTQYCSQGYIGPLCEECDNYGKLWQNPYARSSSYKCNDCNQNTLIYGKIIFVTIAVSIYFYITVQKQLDKSCKRAICTILRQTNLLAINMSCQRNEEISSIQKLLIHFLQITSVMSMNKDLIFNFHELSSIFGQPQSVVSSSFDCILSKQDYIPIHFMRTFYGLFLPIQYIVVSIVLQSVFWLLFNYELKKQFIITSINFGILFFQTGIVKNLIDIIFCRKIGSKFYIKSQVNYECYTLIHFEYIYKYFLPLSLILVFALPLLVLYNLQKNRQKLKYNASTIIRYGLFFLDYKDKTYYWEFVKILLRLLIILVMNFFDQYTQLKYDTCIIILITYCLFFMKLQPFFLAQLNQYELVLTSLTVILFMIERIIVSESVQTSNIFKRVFFIVLVGVWSFFAYIIIKTFLQGKKQFIVKRFKFLQKLFKIKPSPHPMRKFILWKKLKKNLFIVTQSNQQSILASRSQKTSLQNTEIETFIQHSKTRSNFSQFKKQRRFEDSLRKKF